MDFNTKVGVLGGGQLGKMLALAAADWHIPIYALDKSQNFPAGVAIRHFVEGDFKNYDDVYQFGQQVDVITVEIEHVNTAALKALVAEGKTVHPSPDKLSIIQDKGLQKQFYAEKQLPTSTFELFEDADAIQAAIDSGKLHYPFVQKTRTAGYDGQGVAVIRSEKDALLQAPSVIEPLVDIRKELAVIVGRNASGDVNAFPVVEMAFHPTANLVEYLLCPAQIPAKIAEQATNIAKQTIEAYDICGILAVEFFWTASDTILINEVAPRPHNSGHHTIESCYTTQYEQHLRGVLNLPLGSTKLKTGAVMANLLGHPDYQGNVRYKGLSEALSMEGVKIHLYGKKQTKPFRKMGHITVLNDDLDAAISTAKAVKEQLKVVA
ncbi:MAG: 5-(carboxyamino)imidazole ribonucleotide synthase [Bacteroidota bacterium]